MAVTMSSVLVASCLVLQLVSSASLQSKGCMCYISMYDCDIDCTNDFQSDFEVHQCMGLCVRDYVNCRQRCNGERYNIKFPGGFKRSLPFGR